MSTPKPTSVKELAAKVEPPRSASPTQTHSTPIVRKTSTITLPLALQQAPLGELKAPLITCLELMIKTPKDVAMLNKQVPLMSEIVAQIVTKGSDRAEKQTTLVRKSNLRKAVKDIDTTVQSIVKASADYKADRAQTSADRIVKSCKAFMGTTEVFYSLVNEYEAHKTIVDKFQTKVVATTPVKKIDYLTNRESIPSLKQVQMLWADRVQKIEESRSKITKMREQQQQQQQQPGAKARQQVKMSRATRVASKPSSDIESRIGNLLSRFNDDAAVTRLNHTQHHHHHSLSQSSIPSSSTSSTSSSVQSSSGSSSTSHDEDDAPASSRISALMMSDTEDDIIRKDDDADDSPSFLGQSGNLESLEGVLKLLADTKAVLPQTMLLGTLGLRDEGLTKFQQALVKHPNFSKVIGLRLEANDIKNVELIGPIFATPQCNITFLDLKWNLLGAEGAAKLANLLKTNTIIQNLNLEGNDLQAVGAKSIAQMLTVNKTLTFLSLQENFIENEGAVAIAESLGNNKTLKSLILSRNAITEDGAKALATALTTNKTLTSLSLNDNDVGSAGTQAFIPIKSLTSLQLRNNFVEGSAIMELVKSFESNPTLTFCDIGLNGDLQLSEQLFLQDFSDKHPKLVLAWKDFGSNTPWNKDEIDQIVHHFSQKKIFEKLLKGEELEPLVAIHVLLLEMELNDFDSLNALVDLTCESFQFFVNGTELLIELLLREVKRSELDDKTLPIEDLPPLLQVLHKKLEQIAAWVDKPKEPFADYLVPSNDNSKTSSCGFSRLLALALVNQLIKTKFLSLHQRIMEVSLLPKFVDLFFKYPQHNILHNEFRKLVVTVLTSQSPFVINELLVNCELTKRLISVFTTEVAKPIAKRSPMMGPVLLISNTIATCPEEDVKTVLNDDLAWKKFVTQELKPYNEKISGFLGGQPPPRQKFTALNKKNEND